LLTTYEIEDGVPHDHNKLAKLRDEAAEQLRTLKTECRSLNDWFEGLHTVSPVVMQGYRLAFGEQADSTHRWFDEMQADIGDVLHSILGRYIANESFVEHQLLAITADRNLTPKRSLRFWLNARIAFPRFWYEGALAAVDAQGVAPELVEYDVPAAVDCAIAWDVDRFFWSLDLDKSMKR
jgi:hypothetical protein